MELRFELLQDVLRVEVRDRETVEETRELAERMFAEREKHGVLGVMIVFRDSRPLFKVEDYGLSTIIERVASVPGMRLAGVSADLALRAAQEYVTLIAKQRGAPLRNFATEAEALEWLKEKR